MSGDDDLSTILTVKLSSITIVTKHRALKGSLKNIQHCKGSLQNTGTARGVLNTHSTARGVLKTHSITRGVLKHTVLQGES